MKKLLNNTALIGLLCYGLGMTLMYVKAVIDHDTILAGFQDEYDTLEDRCKVAEDVLTIVFGEEWDANKLMMEDITVTPYTSREQETDSTPYHTSIGEHVRPGGAAFTKDMGLDYGQNVLIVGLGVYTKNDHMPGKEKRADIWVGNLKAAQYLGKTTRTAIWLQH